MAGDRFLLVTGDLGVRQAGEIIIALIVFLHMLETEQEELPLGIAADRCTVSARLVASVPLAGGGLNLRFPVPFSACTDAVEIFRIQFHDALIMGCEKAHNKN
ncbi:hypothetical protein D3C87_1700630 [compost metagenome]